MKAVFVFSGQGAQFAGMGKDIFDRSPAAAEVFKEADKALGWSISDICFNGPVEKLTESRYCQPAIYTVSVACLTAFKEANPDVKEIGNAGLSLGEFAALYSSGVFSFVDGLRLVARRGELMDEACKENVGGMASVLGAEADIIKEVCVECGIDVANYNCPGQIVISGDKAGVEKAVEKLKEKGVRKVIPLKVAGAYHSRLMKNAGLRLEKVLDTIPMNEPAVPVAQNFTGSSVKDLVEIKKNIVSQVAGSVRWDDCVKSFIAQGADTFIEFGPGNVLTGLIKRIDKNVATHNVGGVADLEKLSLS